MPIYPGLSRRERQLLETKALQVAEAASRGQLVGFVSYRFVTQVRPQWWHVPRMILARFSYMCLTNVSHES